MHKTGVMFIDVVPEGSATGPLADYYQQQRDVLRRFLRAYRKGSQFMLDKPEEAAQLAVKHATDGQDVARNLEIIKLRNASTVDDGTRANGLGWHDPEIFGKVDSTFAELGITRGRV